MDEASKVHVIATEERAAYRAAFSPARICQRDFPAQIE
jgi:hypothetical protein